MKRNAKKMVTTVLAGVMVMSMGMNAFAAVTEFDLKKVVETDGNTYAPNETFTFNVSPGAAIPSQTITWTNAAGESVTNTDTVYAGLEDGLSIPNGIVFTPDTTKNTAAAYEGTTKVTVKTSVFENKPGVYHYVVSEAIPVEAERYEGIKYDNSQKDIFVYVTTTGGVESVICVENGQKKDLVFTNDYGKNGNNDNDSTHDITVTKEVKGNQGDLQKEFKFNVNVTPATTGEKYKVVKVDDNGETPLKALPLDDGTSLEVSLKNGESVRIYGLSASDEYSIVEQNYGTDEGSTNDGYTTTAASTVGDVTIVDNGSAGKLTVDGSAATVTNTKQITTPTGIILTFAPYILMVAAAGVLAVMFLRKKREEI